LVEVFQGQFVLAAQGKRPPEELDGEWFGDPGFVFPLGESFVEALKFPVRRSWLVRAVRRGCGQHASGEASQETSAPGSHAA
jgi:hypothetical protein